MPELTWRIGPLFMVKKADFELYRFAKKDVELRAVKTPWRNAKIGDVATIQCGRKIYRKRIANIHHGGLARIFMDIDYRRIFPQVSSIFEAVRLTRKRMPSEQQFMAFELEDFI
jgi:ASC-1-like (ASCH) protein